MTRRERTVRALKFENPDSVPYQIDFTGNMMQRMIDYTGGKDFLSKIENHLASAYLIKPQTALGNERFRDEYGVVWNKSGVDKDIGVIEGLVLEDPEDIESFCLPPVDEAFVRGSMERMMKNAGDRFRMGAIGFSMFERAWTLCGMENLLCYMVAEPEFVHRLMGMICERNLKLIDIALEYDIDGFYFGDDWGQQKGMIMGPTHWRTFIKPYISRMYDRVHEAGLFVIQHSCGDIRPVMDEVIDCGLNLYNTYQPEIYTREYAKGLRGRLSIWGGISTQVELPCLKPGEIYDITKAWMAQFPDGGLVCAPTHSVPGDVPPENILAMLAAMRGE